MSDPWGDPPVLNITVTIRDKTAVVLAELSRQTGLTIQSLTEGCINEGLGGVNAWVKKGVEVGLLQWRGLP